METSQEQSDRHDDEALSITVISQQIFGLRELVLNKLDNQDKILATIKEQTIKTNGHVADAFREIDGIKRWKDQAIGFFKAISIVFLPLIMGMLTYLLYLHLKMPS